MSDTVTLRKRGIPTVTIAYDTFEGAARAHAQVKQMSWLPIVVIKHWEPGFTAEMACQEAEGLADELFSALTKPVV